MFTKFRLWGRCLLAVSLAICITAAYAEDAPHDRDALTGLTQAKVVFDITQGDPKRLLGRLKLIARTAQSMADQGVKPEFVLAFRGPASFYASTDRARIPADKHKLADQIRDQIHKMQGVNGVKFEQCAVATGFLKIDNKTILPDIHVVGNSWISLAGYQNRGFAYIPID